MRKSGRMEDPWKDNTEKAGKQKYEDRKQNSSSGWILYAGGI